MSKKAPRRPAAFRIEEVDVFTPPPPPAVAEPESLPVARGRTVPDLGRGLRWGSILIGALGGLIGLLASLWLYDYVLALLARPIADAFGEPAVAHLIERPMVWLGLPEALLHPIAGKVTLIDDQIVRDNERMLTEERQSLNLQDRGRLEQIPAL